MKPGHKRLLALLLVCMIWSSGATRAQTPPTPLLISRTTAGAPADLPAREPAISADGGYLAFATQADKLIEGDRNAVSDVFLYDRRKEQLISLTPGGNGASYHPAISADGRFVVFTSLATNLGPQARLDPQDVNGLPDVYLYDRVSHSLRRISRTADGSAPNGWSDYPAISGDGETIAFISSATNLAEGETGNLYIYRRQDGKIRRLPTSAGEKGIPALSSDGRYLAYATQTGSTPALMLHDLLTGEAFRAPWTTAAEEIERVFGALAISADGAYIALLAGTAANARLYLYDRVLAQMQVIAEIHPPAEENRAARLVSISADGQVIAFVDKGELKLYERAARRFSQPFVQSAAFARMGGIESLAMSADGRLVGFQIAQKGISQVYAVELEGMQTEAALLAGWVSDGQGHPIFGVELSVSGRTLTTGADGSFRLRAPARRPITITPNKKGFTFSPAQQTVTIGPVGAVGLAFIGEPEAIVEEARKDIGMPYSLTRGCESPYKGCGGPFHGFYRGDCTDLVLDAYREGVGFDIQAALERDFRLNPRHYYRWRDARNAHDMWRYFAYTNQILPQQQPYLAGDIVFFDWQMDGVVDHVAVVSEVNRHGVPRKLIDATGVIAENPSGLAMELDWKPYHAASTPGHARWLGYKPSQRLDNRQPILVIALDSPLVSLRVSDDQGRAIDASQIDIPGGDRLATALGSVVSIDQPVRSSAWYFIELNSKLDAPYQLGIQLIEAGQASAHRAWQGRIAAGARLMIPVQLRQEQGKISLSLLLAPP